MKRSHILLFVLLACILLIAPGSAAWLSGGYLYRQEFVVTGDAGWGSSKSNIPVMITCQYETGSSGSGTIYLKNHPQADFDDVRFTTSDGTTLCDYWQQTGFKTDSDYATFWFEAPSLSTGDTTFYIYYGKSSATSASNGSAVFTFFDELDSYDTSKWDVTGTISWSGGGVSLSTANTESKVLATDSAVSTTDTVMTAYAQTSTLAGGSYWSSLGIQDMADGGKGQLVFYDSNTANAGDFVSIDSGTTATDVTGVTANVYHLFSIGRWSGSNKYWINDTLKATHTTNVHTASGKIRLTADFQYKGPSMLWVYIRACPSAFPTYGAVDSEEINPDYEITANFTANVTSGASPLSVSFTNSTDWGDGGTGELWWDYDGDGDFDWIDFNGNETPTTTYYGDLVPGYVDGIPVEDQVGMYNVSLYAENEYLSDWKNETDYITLEAPDDWFPAVTISANVTSGNAPLTVGFTGGGNNTPTDWAWDIDGDTSSPYNTPADFEYTTQNCTHTYNAVGNYTVRLRVDNVYGYSVGTEVGYITVSDDSYPPVAEFSASDTTPITSNSVSFTDLSTNSPTSWEWSWDDGTANSTTQNPSHAWSAAGNYTVTLTATNADGSDTETKEDYISVGTVPGSPSWVTSYSSSVYTTKGCVPWVRTLNGSSANATTYEWDFHYGGSGTFTAEMTGQNVTHTYTIADIVDPWRYTIALRTSNAWGYSAIAQTGSFYPLSNPTTNFVANTTSGMAPLTVLFTDTSSPGSSSPYDAVANWAWDVNNDGVTDYTTQNCTHTYNSIGVYTVKLTTDNGDGCSDVETKTGYITASGAPTPTPTPTVGGGLHFSGNVTPIPTSNASQYYDTIMAGNMTMGEIGAIIPQPLVDALGGGDAGWGLLYFIVFGTAFLILFGRQKNVLIPLLVFLIGSFFFVQYVVSEELKWIAAAVCAAAMLGVILYIAIGRR